MLTPNEIRIDDIYAYDVAMARGREMITKTVRLKSFAPELGMVVVECQQTQSLLQCPIAMLTTTARAKAMYDAFTSVRRTETGLTDEEWAQRERALDHLGAIVLAIQTEEEIKNVFKKPQNK